MEKYSQNIKQWVVQLPIITNRGFEQPLQLWPFTSSKRLWAYDSINLVIYWLITDISGHKHITSDKSVTSQ